MTLQSGEITGLPPLSPAAARVLRRLLISGEASRIELARLTGFTPGAVTRAIQPLLASGLVRESGEVPQQGLGRPATALAVHAGQQKQIGIKITESALIAVVTDLRCTVCDEVEASLVSRQPEEVVTQIAEIVQASRAAHPEINRIGIAVSGDVEPTGHVRYSPFLDWTNVELGPLVKIATGLPTIVENDVRALLTGERWYGIGDRHSSVALVTVGRGIGCAMLVHDQVIRGSHGVAGELGHVLADPNGPLCHCGNRGCVEAIAGSAAILEQMAAAGHHGLTAAEVANRARNGDRDAQRVLAEAGRAIGVGIATVANLFGPQTVVLTGEAIRGSADERDADYDVMEPYVRESFNRHAFGSAADCALELRPLRFADWARGAAACAVEDLVSPSPT